MPKSPSSKLFELVHALSKAEKRTFKIFATRHVIGEKNISTTLFDALCRQKQYNETALKESCGITQHFSRHKNHLYHLIIKSLSIHHSESTASIKIRTLLTGVSILHKKGLYQQCMTMVHQAKKMAKKLEYNGLLSEIISWELLLHRNLHSKGIVKITDTIHAEKRNLSAEQDKLEEYDYLRTKLNETLKIKGSPRTSKEKEAFIKVLGFKKIILSPPKNKSPFRNNYAYHTLIASYAMATGDDELYYQSRKNIVKLFNSNPLQTKEFYLYYISALNNLGIACKETYRYKEMLKTLDLLEKTTPKSTEEIRVKMETFFPLKLTYYIDRGMFKEALTLAKEIEPQLKKYTDTLFLLTTRQSLLYTYLTAGDYTTALIWCNKILNNKEADLRNDIYKFTKIINLIIHFELDNIELLSYELLNTVAYFKKLPRNPSEIALIKCLQNITKSDTKKEQIVHFKLLKKELLQLLNDNPSEKKILDYFDFVSWADSKIKSLPFLEILKRKRERNNKFWEIIHQKK